MGVEIAKDEIFAIETALTILVNRRELWKS